MQAGFIKQLNNAPWPIIPKFDVQLNLCDQELVSKYAKKLLNNEPLLGVQTVFGDGVSTGYKPVPTVYFEDHCGIDLISEESARNYEYRSLCLAGDTDFFLLSRPRAPGFEKYMCQASISSPKILSVVNKDKKQKMSLAKACLQDDLNMNLLVKAAKTFGGLNIAPYISNGHVWLLAAAIARAAGVKVNVLAPPPRLSERANNKLWFVQHVRKLLGKKSVPPTFQAFGILGVVARLRYLAKQAKHVVLKTPASAGGMGNLMYDSSVILNKSASELKTYVTQGLQSIGAEDKYPMLVGVWEDSVLLSPSAQIWIPLASSGMPVLEGIFVQKLEGDTGSFVGATQASLPEKIEKEFIRESLILAGLFQQLGYFGRVSFDALLVGESFSVAELHWIECNARWGGVSIPMTFVHRLGISNSSALSYVIVQSSFNKPLMTSFSEIQIKLTHLLYGFNEKKRGIIWLSPIGGGEPLAMFIAIGVNQKDTEMIANELREILAKLP